MESTCQSSVTIDAVKKNYASNESETDEFTAISDKDEDYNLLLWQAFAGPPPSLPKKGDFVVYFPQGHLEYAASASSLPPTEAPTFDLKPEIICRVVHVQLLVCKKNDKVYMKMTLLPVPEMVGLNLKGKELQKVVVDEKGDGGSPAKSTPSLFSEKLTASDIPGKILIPTKDAENAFPPLDSTPRLFYKKLTASDKPGRMLIPTKDAENVLPPLGYKRLYRSFLANDVHGVEWKFWHVVKGKSRRHYVTEKLKQFFSQKNLVPGDTVVFIRGKNMKLRLGIKRVIQATNDVPDPAIRKHNTFPNILSPVADAISNQNTFDIFYSPRASHPEFVICYQKYMESIRKPVCVGEKFQMQSEMDDPSGKRRSGVVTGTCDLDPNRWPNSKWRCLLVRWDEEMGNCEEQVSPWEINSLSFPSSIHSSSTLKRMQTSLHENSPATSATGARALVCYNSAGDVNRPFGFELQAPVLKNPLPFTLFPDEEIDYSLSLPSMTTTHSAPRLKRLRASLQENAPAFSAPGLDFPESSSALEGEASIITGDVSRAFDLELPAPDDVIDFSLSLPSTTKTHPSPRVKSLRTILQENAPATSTTAGLDFPESSSALEGEASIITGDVNRAFDLEPPAPDEVIDFSLSLPSSTKTHPSSRVKSLRTILQENAPATSTTAGLDFPESSSALEGEASDCAIITGDVNRRFDLELPAPEHHPFDLKLQAPVTKNLLDEDMILGIKPGETLESLEIDSLSSLASFLRCELAASTVKQLKINKCPDLEVLIHRMAYTSLEYLEFNGCLFFSYSKRDNFPTTLKGLKVCNCTNSELILKVLMDQKGLSLESLEIDGCSSLDALPINKLPATLRRLKIVNCMNLKSLSKSSKIINFDSVVAPEGDSSLANMTSTRTLELREFEIWDCAELECLPEGLNNFTCLTLLSISNCPSLESFPEGGLPNTSLTSLLISECENLKSLPHQLHKVTSLQNLSVSGCPSLMSFPQGGLPPNLISLGVIDCENLIALSNWELHKLKHLSKYTFVGGRPDLGDL